MLIKAAAVQLKAWDVNESHQALEKSLKMIDMAARDNPDLVVLPECTYPGYFLGYNGEVTKTLEKIEPAISAYQDKAREHQIYLVVGAPEIKDKKIYNAAYLINRKGEIIGISRKSFLWHFDSKWFSSNDTYEVFETELGEIGMIICADGRQPEISRVLALKGAQLIIDVTNWVTSGSNVYKLSNPQYEYIIPSRAIENKVWYIAANKVGSEAESILYCGKSCIISPNGYEKAVASSYLEEIITAEIDLSLSQDKSIDNEFNIIHSRNTRVYSPIVQDTASLPISYVMGESICPKDMSFFVSIAQIDQESTIDQYLELFEKYVSVAAIQGSRLIIFPELACLFEDGKNIVLHEKALSFSKEYGLYILTGMRSDSGRKKVSLLVGPDGIQNFYEKTHLEKGEEGKYQPGDNLPVFKTPIGMIGVMMGYEGLMPEVARALMLKGADIICWQANFIADYHQLFARTRAAENKVYVAVANTWGNAGCGYSFIAGPNGQVLASALPEGNQLVSTQLDMVLARCKTVVPGTDIVLNRVPAAYLRIVEEM